VSLTAAPDHGSQLDGWGGDCAGQQLTCTVSMDAAHSVTATFADDTPPTAAITAPSRLDGRGTVTFDEPVHDVTTSDLLLRVQGSANAVPASLACSGDSGAADCSTGDVTSASIRPDHPLVPGQSYEVVVNPSGLADRVVDRTGNPAAETTQPFRAATFVEESDLVAGTTWTVVHDRRASGHSYAVADWRGTALRVRFRGTSIRWISARGPDEGRAQLRLDGHAIAIFDGYSKVRTFEVRRSIGGLSDGVHTLRIVVLGTSRRASAGTAVIVDAIEIG
jgi:hypothetical protein